jgi:homocysteine S-methyltransferase
VAGIYVPGPVTERMEGASKPVREGTSMAKEVLMVARDLFSGACIMPPFNHYEILAEILV